MTLCVHKKSSCKFILSTQNHRNMKKGGPPACPPSGQGKPGFLGWIHGGSVHPPKRFYIITIWGPPSWGGLLFIRRQSLLSSLCQLFKHFVIIILNKLLQVGFHSSQAQPSPATGGACFQASFRATKLGKKWTQNRVEMGQLLANGLARNTYHVRIYWSLILFTFWMLQKCPSKFPPFLNFSWAF